MKDIDCHFILSYLKKVEKVDSRYEDLFVGLLVTEIAQNHLIRLQAEEILASLDDDYEEDDYEEDDYEEDDYEDYYGNKDSADEDYEDYEDDEDGIEDVKYNR